MAYDPDKDPQVEEVDTVDPKWQSRHVEESQIPIEQRKAEARLVYVWPLFDPESPVSNSQMKAQG